MALQNCLVELEGGEPVRSAVPLQEQAVEQAVGQLMELGCALTVVELAEAKLQLPTMLPFLSW